MPGRCSRQRPRASPRTRTSAPRSKSSPELLTSRDGLTHTPDDAICAVGHLSGMKILYVGLKYDYADPTRGSSFEHNNFYDTLSRMPEHEVVYFPFDEVMLEQGRDERRAPPGGS